MSALTRLLSFTVACLLSCAVMRADTAGGTANAGGASTGGSSTSDPAVLPPEARDTDGDGLSDWDEVHRTGSDPNNPDTDGDGVGDALDGWPRTAWIKSAPLPEVRYAVVRLQAVGWPTGIRANELDDKGDVLSSIQVPNAEEFTASYKFWNANTQAIEITSGWSFYNDVYPYIYYFRTLGKHLGRNGHVIGSITTDGFTSHAAVWMAGMAAPTLLDDTFLNSDNLDFFYGSIATAVNGAGKVIGMGAQDLHPAVDGAYAEYSYGYRRGGLDFRNEQTAWLAGQNLFHVGYDQGPLDSSYEGVAYSPSAINEAGLIAAQRESIDPSDPDTFVLTSGILDLNNVFHPLGEGSIYAITSGDPEVAVGSGNGGGWWAHVDAVSHQWQSEPLKAWDLNTQKMVAPTAIAKRINDKVEIIAGSQLIRNGIIRPLTDYLPSSWSSPFSIDINNHSVILANATPPSASAGELVLLVPAALQVDSNRDGVIDVSDPMPTSTKPFRFWSNDDDDDGDLANQGALTGNSDEPGKLSGWFEFDGRTPDHAHAGVDGRCDLIDFFPIYLDIKQLLTVLPTTTAGIEYKLKQADAALNFVYTDLARDHAFDYLTKEDAVYGTGMNKLPHLAETTAITTDGVTLSTAFLDKIKNGTDKGVILVEGTKESDKPLVLEVFKGGQSIAQVQVYIKISEVEKMYRWINLRGVAGQSETRPTNTSEPENYPDNRTNGKMFIFVHGYNVNEQQSRGWQAEAFKRMYQAGSRAMFTAVTWHGDHSQIPLIGVSPDYWENITNAFQTAAALPAAVNALPGSSKIIVGHSMGNVVVSSAIKDQSPALNVTKYFMLNAAVALEAYDTSTLHIADMRHPDWSNYNQRLWATQWYDLFPQGDGRRGLTWLNRFGDVPNGINFYSSGEEVLNNNDAASGGTPGQIPAVGGERAWVLQEMVKGTNHIGAVLTFDSQGGWGFNGTWDIAETTNTDGGHAGPTTTYRHRTPIEANALTDDQLKTEPFFRHFQDSRLTTTSGSTAASEYLNRAQILGGAIPALSFPAGGNPIPLFVNQNRNTDLMNREDGWPQERLSDNDKKNRWFHSDAKNIAYRYNHKLWEDWVDRGDLR